MKQQKKIKNKIGGDRVTDIVINTILILLSIVTLYPLWYVIIASFSSADAVKNGEVFLWIKDINLDAYKNALADATILTGYRNSMIYLFVGTLMMLLVTLPCAYALSRKNLKGRRFWNLFFLITMYFSGGLVPAYLLHSSIGWINTPWVLLVPGCVNVYYMILARSSFQEMPESLHDAAIIDGASEFYYFIKIVIPLSKAVIATVFLFSALGWWNSYMPFLIYIRKPEFQSLQVVLRTIFTRYDASMAAMTPTEFAHAMDKTEMLRFSTAVLASLPFCLLYPFVQKYFNRGVMIGAVKG